MDAKHTPGPLIANMTRVETEDGALVAAAYDGALDGPRGLRRILAANAIAKATGGAA